MWDANDIPLAGGANVTSWTGKNGHVMSAASAYPTLSSGGLNGSPMVLFDHSTPANALVCLDALFSGAQTGFSMAMVMKITFYNTGSSIPLSCIGTDTPNNSGETYGNNSLVIAWLPNTSAGPGINVFINQNNDLVSAVINKPRIPFFRELVAIVTYDGVTTKLWIDGICVTAGTGVTGNKNINGGCAIGSLFNDTGSRGHVSVGYSAFGAWNRALRESECRALSDQWRYRFTNVKQPNVILMGDSIGEGTSAAANTTLTDLLTPLLPGVRFVNAARGGQSFAVQSSAASPYPEMYASIRRGDIVVLWPGSIDIANIVSVATVEANHVAIVAALHAKGAIVLCTTMIDKVSASQSTSNTNRATYNTWIIGSSLGVNAGCDGVIDFTNVTAMSADGSQSNLTNFLDGSHPTTVGYTLLLPLLVAGTSKACGAPTVAIIQLSAGVTPIADGTITPVTLTTKAGWLTGSTP